MGLECARPRSSRDDHRCRSAVVSRAVRLVSTAQSLGRFLSLDLASDVSGADRPRQPPAPFPQVDPDNASREEHLELSLGAEVDVSGAHEPDNLTQGLLTGERR